MGRLLSVHPCPVCNYHVEDELHEGGSGSDPVFLRNHYWLATCHDCREIVSVLVANTDEETQAALKSARHQIVQMEADAVIGDYRAKDLLPFFRDALDHFDGSEPPAETVCSICGGLNFTLIADLDGALFDSQEAWIQCPRCDEGQLLVETAGAWA